MIIGVPLLMYQILRVTDKDCSNCQCNSYLAAEFVRLSTEFDDTIQSIENSKDQPYLLFCDGGFCLGKNDDYDLTDAAVIDFVSLGTTTATKCKNENIITFVRNGRDTLRILYFEENEQDGILTKFKITE
jgi:hypothetical protein